MTSGRAKFSARELAEMRVMVALRALGMSLPASRALADEAAPSVLHIAISDHPACIGSDAAPDPGFRYREALDRQTDGGFLNAISGLQGEPYFYILLQGGQGRFLYNLEDPALDNRTDASGLVNLRSVAANLVQAAPRPLFTLLVPAGFG